MKQHFSASTTKRLKRIGQELTTKTLPPNRDSFRRISLHFIVYLIAGFCTISVLVPLTCVAPLRMDTSIESASNDDIQSARTEEQIRQLFQRFQMPMEPTLVHEMAQISQANHVDPRLVAAIVVAESSGNPLAISQHNAIGLLQINAKVWAQKLDFARNNPFDPITNLRLGIPILHNCIKDYRWLDLALAAYLGDLDGSEDGTSVYVNRVIGIYERTSGKRVQRSPGNQARETIALTAPKSAVADTAALKPGQESLK